MTEGHAIRIPLSYDNTFAMVPYAARDKGLMTYGKVTDVQDVCKLKIICF